MKSKFFPTYHPHEAYHHYLKVIRTSLDDLSSQKGTTIYQVLQESQLILYNVQSIPEIKFLWDISPISPVEDSMTVVRLCNESPHHHWWDVHVFGFDQRNDNKNIQAEKAVTKKIASTLSKERQNNDRTGQTFLTEGWDTIRYTALL
ncbi:LOW QUALITY PROTEIN: hypothetical protein ACHAW5_009682 [Stephanodiscus triporus]|uniref:Uncharacterized protein n=1 Tax=Stephanodiscus triporus TaxID=2934178 RepID=A0ABD3NEI1_9STRA